MVKQNSKYIGLCIILYKIFLDFSYPRISESWFYYYNFNLEFDLLNYLLTWVITIGVILMVKRVLSCEFKASSIIFLILLLVSYYPFLTMLTYSAITLRTVIYNSIYFFIIFFVNYVFVMNPNSKKSSVKIKRGFKIIAPLALIVCVASIAAISYIYTGFRFSLSLDSVYEWRSENKASMGVFARYLFGAAIACNVTLISYYFVKRKYIPCVLLGFIQILAFCVDGLKGTLFMLVFSLLSFFIPKKKSVLKYIPIGACGICGVALLESFVLGSRKLLDVILRRIMFLPALITEYYVDFFSINSPDFFRQGMLRRIGFESIYEREISYMIGAVYSIDGINFNSGLLSDAVSNLGIVGVFVMPVVFAIFLKIFDRCAEGLDTKVIFTASIVVAWFALSSTLTTMLFTHGVFILMIFLRLMPRENALKLNDLGLMARTQIRS